jgi:hypothetical protein
VGNLQPGIWSELTAANIRLAFCLFILRMFERVRYVRFMLFLLLTVRDVDTVKHYRIRQLDDGGFFIARRTTFRTLQELVEHYSVDADGLCVNLKKPCVQVCGTMGELLIMF